MTFLLDAHVLSEPTKPDPDAKVIAWLVANESNFVVDPFVLAEINIGLLSLPHGRKREKLEQWFESVAASIECLSWDVDVSLRWARLVVDLRRKGLTMPLLDSMIAATALHHGLILATRNTRDFERAQVQVIDPFL